MNPNSMIRISFQLGAWASTESEGWQAVYDQVVDDLIQRGHHLYGILEPGLALWPVDDKLQGEDAVEAEAWVQGYAKQAAFVVRRYADRVQAFEVLPQSRTGARPEWLAAALHALRERSGDAGKLVAGVPAAPEACKAFVDTLIQTGRARHGWAAGDAPLDGLAVYTPLSADLPDSVEQHAARFDAYRAAMEAAGEPAPQIYVSGFTFDGGGDSLASQVALASARKAIQADASVHLAARASTEMAPVGLLPEQAAPARGDGDGTGGDGEEGGGEVIEAPAPTAPMRKPTHTRSRVPLVDGFDYPVAADQPEPWDGYKIDADVVDPGYKARFGAWHPGEDWNGKEGGDRDLGKPIYAIANGLVVTAGYYRPSWGNVVLLRHDMPDGSQLWSQYAHLNELHVSAGEVVFRGRQLGTLGKGADDKWLAHLHFEIRTTELPADNWFPMARDRDSVLSNYAVPKEFIAANRPAGFGSAPSFVVDEKEPVKKGQGFVRSIAPNWQTGTPGQGGAHLYTYGTDGKESNVGTWHARLPKPGRYQVSAYVPAEHSTTQNANYRIEHAKGSSQVRVDQSKHADAWVPLGGFEFDEKASVRLGDVTGEPDALGRFVAFDAIRFTPLGA